MRLLGYLVRAGFLSASVWGVTASACAQPREPGRVFEAPTVVAAQGWTAACYGSPEKVEQCRVTRNADGAPVRLEITASLVSIALPAGCKNVGLWTTSKLSRRNTHTPAIVTFVERVLAPRDCGLAEAEKVSPLIDLLVVLLSATRDD